MSQPVEIFFAVPPNNAVEAVVLPGVPLATQIAFAYRLVGRYAVMDGSLCENWAAVVISSPEFAKGNHAVSGKQRKIGTRLCFMNPGRSSGDSE